VASYLPLYLSLALLGGFLLVPVTEQICDFSGPIHGFDPDLDCLGFVSLFPINFSLCKRKWRQARVGNSLKRLRVPDCEKVRFSNVWSDGNVSGEIEVDGQQQKTADSWSKSG